MMKNESAEVIKRIERIIQEWEEHRVDSREALELLAPDIKTIICYVESIHDEIKKAQEEQS